MEMVLSLCSREQQHRAKEGAEFAGTRRSAPQDNELMPPPSKKMDVRPMTNNARQR